MHRSLRFLILTAGALFAPPAFAEFTLIAHPEAAAAVSKEDVKNILLGVKTKWDNGAAIKLAVLAQGATHDEVVQTFTARTADQFDKYWKKQVFTGKGVAPDQFRTDAEIAAFVAKTPGAFGYVTKAADAAGAKVLTVN
jgi:ABC-type phosphate transport system substrate-binding protein